MKTYKNQGQLYLVPTPLAEGQIRTLPAMNRGIVAKCQYFLVESQKMGRRHVKSIVPDFDFGQAFFDELNKDTDPAELERLLEPVTKGFDLCILSDAGSPVIADPGSNIVKLAHQKNIEVIPLSGPSSIMLALMASGFNGQQFTFHGYLNRDKKKLRDDLKKIESELRTGYTQIFMETPYRNLTIFDQVIHTMHPELLFCIACDLTAPEGFVKSQSLKQWTKLPKPDIHKRPCLFLLGK